METLSSKDKVLKSRLETQKRGEDNVERLIQGSDKYSPHNSSKQLIEPKNQVKLQSVQANQIEIVSFPKLSWQSVQANQIEIVKYNSSDTSGKSNLRNDSAMSNFDKLSIKSSRISRLNEQLDKSIKEYQKDQKKSNPQKNSNNQQPRKITPKKRNFKFQFQSAFVGILVGIAISIIILLIVIVQINNLSIDDDSQFARDFPTWRGIAIWIFYIWVLGFNVYMFNRHKIRYRQLLKYPSDHYPQALKIYKVAGFFSSIYLVLFLFYLLDLTKIYQIPGFEQEYYASVCWGIFIGFIFMPLPIFSNKGRYFGFSLMLDTILSPFRGVKLRHIWMADQLTSMAIPFKDLQYTFCYYTQLDYKQSVNVCREDGDKLTTGLIVAILLCSTRIVQNFRQGYDSGQFFMSRSFFNSIKYSCTMITSILAYEYKLGANSIQSAWLLFAIISTIYSYVWDLKIGWNLLQKNPYHPLLREKLLYGSPKIYYLIMIGNLAMRLTWVITLSPKLVTFIGSSNLVYLVTGTIQIFRRGIWNLIRMEKQHILQFYKSSNNDPLMKKKPTQQQKLPTGQNSLQLQIKMLKFIKKFNINRQILKDELERLNQNDLFNNQIISQTYYGQFQQDQRAQISQLMGQILKAESFLKIKRHIKDMQIIKEEEQTNFKEDS